MRNHRFILALLAVAVLHIGFHIENGGSNPARAAATFSDPSALTPVGQTGDWTLLFSDDFDGSVLDASKWSTCFPWGGRDGCTLESSRELEWYQPDNVSVGDGILKLRAQKRPITAKDGRVFDYASGMIATGWDHWHTAGPPKFSFQHGFAEIRAKVPRGAGLWPSFWMLSADQEWPPEMRIMAISGNQPRTTNMRTFYSLSGGESAHRNYTWTGPDFSAGWHTFAIDWQPAGLIWYVDGIPRARFLDTGNAFSEPMYLIVSLAVGGSVAGPPSSSTPFPSHFEVDYVRVWRRTEAAPVPTSIPVPTRTPTIEPSSQRVLLFSEDFNGTSLDTDKWTTCYPWDYEGCTNASNQELEWYLPDNILVEDGMLRLRAQKQTFVATDGNTYHYTSGMVTTGPSNWSTLEPPKFSFQNGYVEIRARIPKGQGLWPAFWLIPVDPDSRAELDVMEMTGDQPNIQLMSVHYVTPQGRERLSNRTWSGPDFSADWHTFSVDWQPTAIIWYVDGVERWRETEIARIPAEPMFLIGNLAVGGYHPGPPDGSTPFPSYLEIDYVRVWNRRD